MDFLTVSSFLVTGALTLNLTENFGTLAQNGSVKLLSDNLSGTYGNALTGMSAFSIGVGALYIFLHAYRLKFVLQKMTPQEKAFLIILFLTILIGFVSVTMDLYLTTNYGSLELDELKPSPFPPVAGQNYALRGPYGTATMSMAAISTFFSGVSLLGMVGFWSKNQVIPWIKKRRETSIQFTTL